ncbi:MAG: hypothetical protein H7641_01975, partial [Candidatus Heimdallarchaeota archaeon]|nr:hypothetical protein [Candidatus Heimdallarchaeota archaeon]MCK4876331.1 hypothetical protein [Candidatus Heimdallarchaeota archaeon]
MLIYLGSLIAVILIGTLAIGDGFVGGEYDIGTTIFSLLFIFAPLMMLMYVFNDVSKKSEIEEVEELASSKSTKIVGLYIASGTILVLGGLILSLGMICIIKPNLMASFFNFSNNILFYLGIVFTIIA